MRIEIDPGDLSRDKGPAVLLVYTEENDAWCYVTCDVAKGHLCGYLQAKGLDASTAQSIALEQMRQALTIYQMTFPDGPHVLG